MPGPNSQVTTADGTLNFRGGVNSIAVPTVQSNSNPDGLKRNELAWMINGTVRDGGITPRAGWKLIGRISDGKAPYQGGWMYQPKGEPPYLVLSIGGNIVKADPDGIVENLLISATVFSTPTAPPWFITLRNRERTTTTTFLPPEPLVGFRTPPDFPAPGKTFNPASPQYLGLLGTGFTPFVIPPVGADVTVTLGAPYTGAVGDIIKLTADFSLTR